MRRPHAGKASRFGLDHRPEVIAAVSALLLQVSTDGGEVVLGQRFRQERPVGRASQGIRGAERGLGRVQREEWIAVQPAQGRATRPRVRRGIRRPPGFE